MRKPIFKEGQVWEPIESKSWFQPFKLVKLGSNLGWHRLDAPETIYPFEEDPEQVLKFHKLRSPPRNLPPWF